MFVHKSVEVAVDPAVVAQKEAERKAREEDELASTVEEEEEVVKINLKEIDRVYYHVLAIENDCHIIPQGSMKLTPTHEVERNEAFQGLPPTEAFDIKCYSHFRNVQDKVKKDNLEADDAIFQRDFLDGVHEDLPKGCWSLQKVEPGYAFIRNNVWKGYTAYHEVGTKNHGTIYVGDGLKNLNACFMMSN